MATLGGMAQIWLLVLLAHKVAKAVIPATAVIITPQAAHLRQVLERQNIRAAMVANVAMAAEAVVVAQDQAAQETQAEIQAQEQVAQADPVALDPAAQVARAAETVQADRQAAQVRNLVADMVPVVAEAAVVVTALDRALLADFMAQEAAAEAKQPIAGLRAGLVVKG